MLFWPEASNGQNSVTAMSASASDPTLEFSRSRSMAILNRYEDRGAHSLR
jgi:hypothetical protein